MAGALQVLAFPLRGRDGVLARAQESGSSSNPGSATLYGNSAGVASVTRGVNGVV